jgi:hypothetical protein
MQEKDGARRGLRHDGGRMRRVEGGEMERERVVGKAAGDKRVFIPGRGSGWQMKPASDAIPDAAGGE